MRVIYKREPRTIAVYSRTHTLAFRQLGEPQKDSKKPPAVAVEIIPNEEVSKSHGFKTLFGKVSGCLGLIYVDNQVFLAVITGSIPRVASPVHYETVDKIYSVDFISLSNDEWDFVNLDTNGMPVLTANAEEHDEGSYPRAMHPCHDLKKLLSNGSFYYSNDFDLTSMIQNRGISVEKLASKDIDHTGKIDLKHYLLEYMWNSFMMEQLLTIRSNFDEYAQSIMDENRFLTTVIRGFAKTVNLNQGDTLTVISKQSWKRAGTRFNARGIDDDGNVANYVETECIYNSQMHSMLSSFTQIRGSVPTFWEQDTTLINPKITITRSLEATQPIFNKHFNEICQKYGVCHIVNLLSKTKPAEVAVLNNYKQLYRNSNHKEEIAFSEFDFHHETKGVGFAGATKIMPLLRQSLENFGWFVFDLKEGEVVTRQDGVFRTNCLDCLDRTNLVQQVISLNILEVIMDNQSMSHGNSYRDRAVIEDTLSKHNFLWADNGDAISQIYTGTNALKSSFSRSGKMNFAGALSDVTKSVSRMYQNTFTDNKKQSTMDLLLGYDAKYSKPVTIYDPINDYVQQKLNEQSKLFTKFNDITIFTGTFNISAASFNTDIDFTNWLFPPENMDMELPAIYAIGIQELIELNAGSILNADSSKALQWAKVLEQELNSQSEQYLLLRTESIASMAIFLFVKKSLVQNVTQVSGSSKKTGLGGISANKGACAVRFEYGLTSFVMLTSHLAAGVNATTERHNDYQTILQGLKFTRNYAIKDHDHILWFGDLNYRISMQNEQCRYLIESGAFDELFQADQLNQEYISKGAFYGFKEGSIKFYPTYKFDKRTSNYDTSEKQRVPSWTDRVLYKSSRDVDPLKQLNYNSVMGILLSDHKPVYSTFNCRVKFVDENKKLEMSKVLYEKYKAEHDKKDGISLLDDSNSINSKSLSSLNENFATSTLSELNLLDDIDLNAPSLPSRPVRQNTLPRRRLPPPVVPRNANFTHDKASLSKENTPSNVPSNAPSNAPTPPPARKVVQAKIPIGFSSTPLIPSRSNSLTPFNGSPVGSPGPHSARSLSPSRPLNSNATYTSNSGILQPLFASDGAIKPLVPVKPTSLSLKATKSFDQTTSTLPVKDNQQPTVSSPSKHNEGQSLLSWKPLVPK